MGGVSPVGAGAHGLRLPATTSRRLLLYQLTPLELWPDAQKHTQSNTCIYRCKEDAKIIELCERADSSRLPAARLLM